MQLCQLDVSCCMNGNGGIHQPKGGALAATVAGQGAVMCAF